MIKKIQSLLPLLICFNLFCNSQEIKEISGPASGFQQKIEVTTDKQINFKLTGAIRVQSDSKDAMAGLFVKVDNHNDENGFMDALNDRVVQSGQWKTYEIVGLLDQYSKTLNFGGFATLNGKFYFDDIKLYIENAAGEYEEVPIKNPSFEDAFVSENLIPEWYVTDRNDNIIIIKEFTSSQTNDSFSGKKALLIEGKGIKNPKKNDSEEVSRTIGDNSKENPQIESMISMLEDLKKRVEFSVKDLSQYEIDHLHDEKANRIGALIMHLAAAEKYYQVFTLEGRKFNAEEEKEWGYALDLDQGGRDKYQGHEIQYYLDKYNEVRKKTIEELRKKDDKWFEEIQPIYNWSNQYCWFHVMEHQSSHLGQILFLKKRIPPQPSIEIPEEIKN